MIIATLKLISVSYCCITKHLKGQWLKVTIIQCFLLVYMSVGSFAYLARSWLILARLTYESMDSSQIG